MAGRILVDRTQYVAEIRVDNPTKHNAMSLAMWLDLAAATAEFAADESVRVLLLRGQGQQAFVSGADISEFDTQRSAQTGSERYDAAVEQAQAALMAAPFPVVASIHGVCMGGGLGLALACDLRYAATDARFRMPAARLGLGYSFSGIRRMVEVIGAPTAAELFYTARTLGGEEARRIGIVNDVFPDGELDDAVARIVSAIAENAPLTVRLAKAGIALALKGGTPQAEAALERARSACIASEDYVEGRRAFAEKRPPRFLGR